MASMPDPARQQTLVAIAAGRTDVGRRRDHNEDQILVADAFGLFAVADGMGGHQAGDVASSIAAASLEQFFWKQPEVVDELQIDLDEEISEGAKRLVAAIHHCNRQVFAKSGRSANQGGMGSTVVALFIDQEQVHIAHVGDSRCYRIREQKIEQMTRDHSMINEALRLNPDLSPEILKQLPSNVVTRALGTKEDVQPDVRSEPLVEGDIYLLCSDGLSGEVSDEDLLFGVLESERLSEACELLVAMANEAGGKDNISALLVRIADANSVAELEPDSQALVMAEPSDSDAASADTQELEDEDLDEAVDEGEADEELDEVLGDAKVDEELDEELDDEELDEDDEVLDEDDEVLDEDDEVLDEVLDDDLDDDLDDVAAPAGTPAADDAAAFDVGDVDTRDLPDDIDDDLDDDEDELPAPPGAARAPMEYSLSALEPPYGSLSTVSEGAGFDGAGFDSAVFDSAVSLDPPRRLDTSHPYALVASDALDQSGDPAHSPAFAVVGIGEMDPYDDAPPSTLARCRECGHKLLPEERFCGMCGNLTDDDADPNVARCDACGHEVYLGTRYCVECGVRHGF
jgi:protein phosphatase